VREHQAALEQLQTTNEEALSSNEELQSVNEELQTAKEEIQSANEELATLNQELQDRNLKLGQTNDDLLNLLGSVNLPVVMVGRDLRVRRFTPAAEGLFSLASTDVGRPLFDVQNRLQAPELAQEIRNVLDSATVSAREVLDRDGRVYAMKIWPYLTRAGAIDGAVVVLVDVDDLKRAAQEIQRALDRANAIVATVREPLLILDGRIPRREGEPGLLRHLPGGAAGDPRRASGRPGARPMERGIPARGAGERPGHPGPPGRVRGRRRVPGPGAADDGHQRPLPPP
jgi:two-component system CheB/CheR fusion protein